MSRAAEDLYVSAIIGPVVATSQGRLGTFYTEEETLSPPRYPDENGILRPITIVTCNALVSRTAMDKVGHSNFPIWSENEDGMQELAEAELISPLVKAIQELSEKVSKLENKE